MTEPIRLCKDCKWYRKNWLEHLIGNEDRFDLCFNPIVCENFVTGGSTGRYCNTQRNFHQCGPKAKYWESK